MGHSLSRYTRSAPFRALGLAFFAHKGLCFFLICWMTLAQSMVPQNAAAWGEFTIKDEKELGRKFNVMIRARMPLVQDPEVVKYVEGIVNRLASKMPPQPFPFTTSVIRHNSVNAFACPGGYIFVHTGLILAMRHESEIAGVIAHEMAHVTQRHIAGRIEQSQMVGLLSLVGALAGAFLGGDAGSAAMVGSMAAGQAAMLDYSRSDENEADQVGMNYLTKAGYSPKGMGGAFEVLSRRQWLMGSKIPTYLSTHPGIQDRIKDMALRVSKLPEAVRSRKDDDREFLRIQALVRARYSDPAPAEQEFAKQTNGPNRCMALMGQGILSSRQNRVIEASNFFEQALACNPKDELIVREAGIFHYSKGNRNKGSTLLQQAVNMDKTDIMALFFYARNLDDSGMTDQAIDYTRQVLRAVPEDAEVHTLLAHLYGEKGSMFPANLHMAYAGLYENNKKRVDQFFGKAKTIAATPEEKQQVERFETEYKDRKEFW